MTIILKNCTLINGTGTEPIQQAFIELDVVGKKIIHVGQKDPDKFYGQSNTVVDLKGRYVIPGLIDTHVHLSGSGEPDSHFVASDPEMLLIMLQNAQKNLAAGITTIRDVGGWNELEFVLRKTIQKEEQAGARILAAGRFISISESGAPYYPGMYREADGAAEVVKAVREQIKNGADLIKFGVTGAVLVEDGIPGAAHFNFDELSAGIQEAKKFGKKAAAHAHGVEGIRLAVEAGADTIEHGTFLHQDPDLIRLMAQKQIFLIPTLHAGWAVLNDQTSNIPEWILEKSRPIQADSELSLRMAYQAGVPIAMGSDAATPLNFHGENAIEVFWMHKAGMNPMDAILAATKNAARAIGMQNSLGTIEAGKLADLVILNANPLEDLRLLADKQQIFCVIKEGKIAAIHRNDPLLYPYPAKHMLWID